MHILYNINWLKAQYEAQEKLHYFFFWGHTPKEDNIVDKSCLSQWYNSTFIVDGKLYASTEHWMMSQKALLFNDKATFEKILSCENPAAAKNIGRLIQNYNDESWDKHKMEIVVKGNIHKFGQNEILLDFLLNTLDKILVEASPVDSIWGIGLAQDSKNIEDVNTWRGENLLGFALMQVRDYLKENEYSESLNL